MPRVSNRQILESNREIIESIVTLAEAVATGPAYPDSHAPTMELERGEYYDIATVMEEAKKCYTAYHWNPLFRRAVDLKTSYVWGRGVTLMSPQPEVNEVVRDFLVRNHREIGHLGRTEKDVTLTLEGNLFFLCKTDEMGAVTIQQVPMGEIAETRRDTDDYRTIWYIKRTYIHYEPDPSGAVGEGEERSVYHPTLGYDPEIKPASIDTIPVDWSAPLFHMPVARVGKEIYALPPFSAAVPWATSYSHFLSQIASIASSLSRFAVMATAKTPSGAKKLETLLNTGTAAMTNPTEYPATGSVLVGTEGITYDPIKTAGVMTNADEGRRFALMVGSVTHTPEHMLMADPSTGNLATTKMMERPYELSIVDRQLLWADALETLITYGVEQRVKAGTFTPLTGDVAIDEYGRKRIMVDVTTTVKGEDGADDREMKTREEAKIVVEFPSVLEHDMIMEIGAIIDMATLRGMSMAGIVDKPTLRRMLLSALNVPDVDDVIANMDIDDSEDDEEPPEADEEPVSPVPPVPDDEEGGDEDDEDEEPEAGPSAEEVMADAVHALRDVVSMAMIQEAENGHS